MKTRGIDSSRPLPKKYLGQNFLKDTLVLQRLVDSCELDADDVVLEIGPGQGALTAALLPLVKKVIAIEKDRQLAECLSRQYTEEPRLTVHHADFLQFDVSSLPRPLKLIGNIPYYISTPILEKVLKHRRSFSNAYVTAQLEFGQRLVARAGSREYSSPGCFTQTYSVPTLLFKISPASFSPAPRVMSCFLRLQMRSALPFEIQDEELYERIVRQVFVRRRKTVLNALLSLYPKAQVAGALRKAGIAENLRPENLTPENYATIANIFANKKTGE